MKTLYIDTVEGFTFQGSYMVNVGDNTELRTVYAAPLPYLALVCVRGVELWECLGKYVDVNIGWANKRGANEWKCSYGHIPGTIQTKINIRGIFITEHTEECRTLSQVVFNAPLYRPEVKIAA